MTDQILASLYIVTWIDIHTHGHEGQTCWFCICVEFGTFNRQDVNIRVILSETYEVLFV